MKNKEQNFSNIKKRKELYKTKWTKGNRFISVREMKIIELLEEGLTNQEISKILSIHKRELYSQSINNYRNGKGKNLN